MEFAFRRRYLLPVTDQRFLEATAYEIATDYWAHRFWDDPKLLDEVVNPDFEDDLAEMERQVAADDAAAQAVVDAAAAAGDMETLVDETYGGDL